MLQTGSNLPADNKRGTALKAMPPALGFAVPYEK
jgi:hypothetical protein